MYRWYQVIICLLKFDFFFFAGVTMQVIEARAPPLTSILKVSSNLAFDPRCLPKFCRVRYYDCRHSDRPGAPILCRNRGATRDQVADVYFTRSDVGCGIILCVITITRNDPLTNHHPVGVQSVRRLTL